MKFRPIEIVALVCIIFLIIYVVAAIFTHPFVNVGDGTLCLAIFILCGVVVLWLARK